MRKPHGNSISETSNAADLQIFMAARAALNPLTMDRLDRAQEVSRILSTLQQKILETPEFHKSEEVVDALERCRQLIRAQEQLVAVYKDLWTTDERFRCREVEAKWRKIRSKSGLPDEARPAIEAVIVRHRAWRALGKRPIPNSIYELHKELGSLVPILNSLSNNPDALSFLLTLSQDENNRWDDHSRITAITKAARTLWSILRDLDEWAASTAEPASRGAKADRPFDLVQDLNDCYFFYTGQPIKRTRSAKDFLWIRDLCDLVDHWSDSQIERAMQAVVTSHHIKADTQRYSGSRRQKKRRSKSSKSSA